MMRRLERGSRISGGGDSRQLMAERDRVSIFCTGQGSWGSVRDISRLIAKRRPLVTATVALRSSVAVVMRGSFRVAAVYKGTFS